MKPENKMKLRNPALCALLILVPLFGAAISAARAQAYPTRLVKIIVPYPPGGGVDLLARALASDLSPLWNQPVVVENVAGAGSIVGAEKVASAAPDGHTLLMSVNPTVVGNRFLFKKLPYDPDKGLAPVSMITQTGQFVLAHPSFAAVSLREMIAAARQSPGKISYSSFGNGSQPQLLFETIAKREGVEFLHVPYKGIAPAMTALVAGEVLLSVASPAQSGTMVKAGRLKALAIAAARRAAGFPDVPTSADSGYPYAAASIWFALFATGGTSAQLVERIYRDATSVARRPEFTEKHITSRGLELVANTPAEFAAAIRAEVELTAEMVKAAGIQPE